MHKCTDYDKILQLVKSDDTNNRLLGFQLAKGQGYDLFELIENVEEKSIVSGGGNITVGDVALEWRYSEARRGFYFKTSNDEEIKHIVFIKDETLNKDSKAFEDTITNFKKLFINLITE